jgi:uncharacterized membrane protein YbhN (UPF0104 family)
MRISRGALLRATLGIAISVFAIFVLVNSVNIEAALRVLRTASPAWIAVMFVTALVDIGARGARWRALLAPIAPLPYGRVLGYTYIGYLANNVLPARLGELYRSHALGEGEGVSRPTVLGTVVVERVVDTVMVVAIAAIAVLVLSVRGVMSSAVLLGLALVAVALVFSAVAWTASTATFLVAGQAVGVELSVAQAALITSGVALVSIVPSGPGYVGTFELTVVAIADGLGIPRDPAFALGLLVHVVVLLVTSVGGVIAMLALRRRRDAAAASASAVPGSEPAP